MIIVEIVAGLGNQMFLYAFGKGMAQKYNDRLMISKSAYEDAFYEREFGLDHFQLSTNCEFIENHKFAFAKYKMIKIINSVFLRIMNRNCCYVHRQKDLREYEDLQYRRNKMNIYSGALQSEKYFENVKNEIKEDFTFKDIRSEVIEFGNKLSEEKSVCIHIRRGDYLKLKQFTICTIDYYQKAMQIIKERIPDAVFYAFSDDINWVKDNLPGITPIDFTNDMYEDLYLMTRCNNYIMSNSTFSFWGQYLSDNNDKIVIAPNKWLSYKNTVDDGIYNEDWLLIDVEDSANDSEQYEAGEL